MQVWHANNDVDQMLRWMQSACHEANYIIRFSHFRLRVTFDVYNYNVAIRYHHPVCLQYPSSDHF